MSRMIRDRMRMMGRDIMLAIIMMMPGMRPGRMFIIIIIALRIGISP
jgi:hypothetical protein